MTQITMHRHMTVAFDGSQTSESDPSGDRAHDVEADHRQPRSSISAPSVLSRHLTVAFDGRVPDDVAAGESVNVAEIQARDESNSMCADCSAQNPTWASVNVGAFICTLCAGVHRSLGTHISKVQSLIIDKWTHHELAQMHTNDFVNATLEYHVPPQFPKPRPDSSRSVRQKFIRAKYEARCFVKQPDLSPLDPVIDDAEPDAALLPCTTESSLRGHNRSKSGMVEYEGVLMVRLLSARGLAKADFLGLSDPYCVLEAVPSFKPQPVRSRVIANSLDPLWNETIPLMVENAEKQSLQVSVFDKDLIGTDDFLGDCLISLSDPRLHAVMHPQPSLPAPEAVTLELPLSVQGSVQLCVSYEKIEH